MRSDISCSNWMHLHPVISHGGEAIRPRSTHISKHQGAITKVKLGDESTLTGPFPHPSAGKGVRHG